MTKKNQIILKANSELIDNGAREYLSIIYRRIEVLNDRTKRQTGQITEMSKRIKKLEKQLKL